MTLNEFLKAKDCRRRLLFACSIGYVPIAVPRHPNLHVYLSTSTYIRAHLPNVCIL